jgi:hypothetical protein
MRARSLCDAEGHRRQRERHCRHWWRSVRRAFRTRVLAGLTRCATCFPGARGCGPGTRDIPPGGPARSPAREGRPTWAKPVPESAATVTASPPRLLKPERSGPAQYAAARRRLSHQHRPIPPPNRNNVRRSAPPSMHAKQPRSRSIDSSTAPPARTRTHRLLGTSAYHMAPSEADAVGEGRGRSAHPRRLDRLPFGANVTAEPKLSFQRAERHAPPTGPIRPHRCNFISTLPSPIWTLRRRPRGHSAPRVSSPSRARTKMACSGRPGRPSVLRRPFPAPRRNLEPSQI